MRKIAIPAVLSMAVLVAACGKPAADAVASDAAKPDTPAETAATPPSAAPAPAQAPATDATAAHATLEARSGSKVAGTLQVSPMGDGVHVTGQVTGLTPNADHGFHVHQKGDCSAADASSAGDHFNPTAQPHGKIGDAPHHLGDQMNLHSDANGNATVDAHFSGLTLGTGKDTDVMGRALVVHADPDDYKSQPSGNSGKRVACGVIMK